MNLEDYIQSEIRIISEKIDKINEANLNIPTLLTLFSHIRGPVKTKEEITDTLIGDLSHQDKNQLLMKDELQINEWLPFTGEGEYYHKSLIKTIEILQEEHSIPDELMTAILHSLFEKSAKRWYYSIRQTDGKITWSWWRNEIIIKWENDAFR
ncbi:hypothetical protein O181_106163 [Austropuccinia psidii MF-1]|uniref:Uncharacterized protein n=1 Tax=Austropuccinia psidii MF-1 TaxID=1389203 RepID=A0A9Q3PLP7_9BASI|nr:hypothetical protein [Austropuccinia psidii MF-1]